MKGTATTAATGERVFRRILGSIDQGRPGPTFLAQGGIHGNEPGGVYALQRILDELRRREVTVYGRIVACAGNLEALARNQRFLDRDLNRQWRRDAVEALEQQSPGVDGVEDREQRELLAVYEECYDTRRGPLVFLDLHSSSADGPPFTCMGDTLPNRRIADAMPVPMILGLEECIDGAVMEWFERRGMIGVAIEGGRHDAEYTVDNLEAAIWLAMAQTGVVARSDVDEARHHETLRRAAQGLPHVVEIRHRQAITPDDRFSMVPGYVSFQPVTANELLAHDRNGPLRAAEPGMVLLPLYQGQGEDGYFLCRRVARFWFSLSGLLRRLRLDRVVRWFPGVHVDPDDEQTLLADHHVARMFTVQVFHLFGYRRRRPRGDLLAFSRRHAADESHQVGPR